MMGETPEERLMSTEEGQRLYRREQMIQQFTDAICEAMNEQGVSREELNKELDLGPVWVDRLLDGSAIGILTKAMIDTLVFLGISVRLESRGGK